MHVGMCMSVSKVYHIHINIYLTFSSYYPVFPPRLSLHFLLSLQNTWPSVFPFILLIDINWLSPPKKSSLSSLHYRYPYNVNLFLSSYSLFVETSKKVNPPGIPCWDNGDWALDVFTTNRYPSSPLYTFYMNSYLLFPSYSEVRKKWKIE